jgi:hypothetical protein
MVRHRNRWFAAAILVAVALAAAMAGVAEPATPDTIDPTVTLTSPAADAQIVRGSQLSASYSCQDDPGGSGIDSCVGAMPESSTIDTSTVGHHSFTVRAIDRAGNATTTTHAYTIIPESVAGHLADLAVLRSELVSMRSGALSFWSRFWLDNAIESVDWAAQSSCWTASGALVTTVSGLVCLEALRLVVLRLYYADAVLRGASKPQQQETVDLLASIAGDRLGAVASTQTVDPSKWRASGPTALLWAVDTDLKHADADSNRIEATIAYIRAWRRLSEKVGLSSQSIAFAPLADKTFGNPAFRVSATASSGLEVSFAAVGSCSVSGNTVQLKGAGSCLVSALQQGNSVYNPTAVLRTFSIAKASQTIAFGRLASKALGAADSTVSASASSGLAVAFAASGSCTLSAATVHPTGLGSCTVTASQSGNANYDAARVVSQTFSITARPKLPARCAVPKVVGRQLRAAQRAIKAGHCRTGRVGRAYSRRVKKGSVISQSRRARRLLPVSSKINLVVSRGRKR